jgi:acrosin
VVEKFRNRVQLIPRNQSARTAQLADVLLVGDAIATAKASLVELRFNDGSLARLGEQTLFRFAANTRTFHLSNGTVLLLIPPGNGRTTIRTPNAAAGIRGSGMFLRHTSTETENLSLIAALTDSDIEVYDPETNQWRTIQGGQMALVRNNRLDGVYEFDLRQFYETSPLAEGLALTALVNGTSPDNDAALDAVRTEIAEALARQEPIVGNDVVTNPSFLRLPTSSSDRANTFSDEFPVDRVVISPNSDELGQGSPGAVNGQLDLSAGAALRSGASELLGVGEFQAGRIELQDTSSPGSAISPAADVSSAKPPASVPNSMSPTTPAQPVVPSPPTTPPGQGGTTPTPPPLELFP